MQRTISSSWLTGIAMAIAAAALFGCSATQRPESAPLTRRAFGGPRPVESIAPDGTLVALPPEEQAALSGLGMLRPSAHSPAHAASTALPFNLQANQQYGGDGGAGYVSVSSDVSLSLSGLDMQPAGLDYPANFSYVVYRIDDISQALTKLTVNCGNHPPGMLGIAAY